jgi:hypothetical protein
LAAQANGRTAVGISRCFSEAARCRRRRISECRTLKQPRCEKTNETRAAVTEHNVRHVLRISTLAAIVLFAVAYLVTKS